MALYFRTARWFSRLSSILGQHSLSIINSNPDKYKECRQQMEQLIELPIPQATLKKRLNMVFAVSNLNESLMSYKQCLFSLIRNSQVESQSDLDRIVNWLGSELRVNNSISEQDIVARLKGAEKDGLVEELSRVFEQEGREQDHGELSKLMREMFPAVDSKTIYKEISSRFTHTPRKTDKQIWDKIPGLKPRLLPYQANSPQIYAEHKAITGGKLRFRFPPEPNGYLHIGHCKSIRTNFESAKRLGGTCNLRFDDTNPDNESHEYIDNIEKEVKWMGYEPDRITYASDYFEELMSYAVDLIKANKAYVCNTPKQEIGEERKNKQENPDRNRQYQYSLKHFPNLQPHQTLRLRLDSQSSNPTLRDPVIYRNKNRPHPRTGSKYKVYPTYDFTHCISDSLEHIDYSFCSLEFEIRRELYYTILNLLGLYKPIVWEYSRLNISGNVLSKRKITKLIQDKVVEGWEDPRLMTMAGLRNRGYTPSIITAFIDRINVSRSGNESIVQSNLLTMELKKELFKTASRTMAVLEPVLLTLNNLKETQEIDVKLFPQQPGRGSRKVKVSNKLYVEKSEGLKEGDIVNLKYFKQVRIDSVKSDGSIEASIIEDTNDTKRMKNIHWISQDDSILSPVKQYFSLYKQTSNPQPQPNPITLAVYQQARIPRGLDSSKIYQFERIGYFKFYMDQIICCCRI